MEFLFVLIAWIVLSIVVAVAADSKGRSGAGFFFLSLFFSPLVGFLAVIAMPSRSAEIERQRLAIRSRKCPFCAEMVLKEATVCRFCSRDLPSLSPPITPPVPEAKPAPIIQPLAPPPQPSKPSRPKPRSASVKAARAFTIVVVVAVFGWVLAGMLNSYLPPETEQQRRAYAAMFEAHYRKSGIPMDAVIEGRRWERLVLRSAAFSKARVDDMIRQKVGKAAGDNGFQTIVFDDTRGEHWTYDIATSQFHAAASAATPARPSPSGESAAARVGPAPSGEAATVALRIILENFDPPDCPRIRTALRMEDGGIHAVCTNKEIYRIFTINDKPVAMRCSALRRMGISAC